MTITEYNKVTEYKINREDSHFGPRFTLKYLKKLDKIYEIMVCKTLNIRQ